MFLRRLIDYGLGQFVSTLCKEIQGVLCGHASQTEGTMNGRLFWPISRFIAEKAQDMAMVAMENAHRN